MLSTTTSQRLKGAQLNETLRRHGDGVGADLNASSRSRASRPRRIDHGAYLDYNRRDPVTAPPSFTGRIVPFTPKDKLNLGATFKQPLGDDKGELTFSTNYAYKSSLFLGLIPFINVAGGNVYDGEPSV